MKKHTIKHILAQAPMVPVLVIDKISHAVPITKALVAGGLPVIEVTLRTEVGIYAITKIKSEVPDAIVGAGTILQKKDLYNAIDAGADFQVTPGITQNIMTAAIESDINIMPGISTVSEIMQGIDYGIDVFKFFPAEVLGGVTTLSAFLGPLPKIRIYCQ